MSEPFECKLLKGCPITLNIPVFFLQTGFTDSPYNPQNQRMINDAS